MNTMREKYDTRTPSNSQLIIICRGSSVHTCRSPAALFKLALLPCTLQSCVCICGPLINPRRACTARVTVLVCVCVCVSVQSNLRSCANTRATRNTYGFSVTRIVKPFSLSKIKKPFSLSSKVRELFAYRC